MKKSFAFAGVAVVAAGVSMSAAASAAPAPVVRVPVVSSVSPARISTTGGATVTITGSNLTGVATVTIGGQPASAVTVVSSGKITAVAPAGVNGAAAVSVTSSAGTNVAGLRAAGLTYRTPLGIDVSGNPAARANGGPMILEITGGTVGADAKAFATERVTVTMGRTSLATSYVDAGHVKVTMPATTTEQAQLTVVHDTIAGAPATVTVAPVVTSLSARDDTVVGGRKVTVRVAGVNVAAATGFAFGANPATCTAKGALFECVVPPAAEAGPVWVSFVAGSGTPSRFTAASAFSYTD